MNRKIEGWDAADAIEEWSDLAALREAALRLAVPYKGEDTTFNAAPGLGDDERESLAKLGHGDFTDFLARARSDPGFPFEPEAIAALNKFARDRLPDWQRLVARLKAEKSVRLAALEAAMRAAVLDGGEDDGESGLSGRPLTYDEIEPWPDPVDGATLLNELSSTIGEYVVMEPYQRDATALWTGFAHAHDMGDYGPPLVIKSPVKRCGKTRLQETLARLVPKPQITNGITAALLPRLVEKHRPTLLIDEYDAQAAGDRDMAESLRGQLNSSFNKSSAGVLRLVPLPGGGWDERRFSTWAPTCVAGIGKQSDTVEDRSVIIRLARKKPGVKVRRLRGKDGGDLAVLARKLARFVNDNEAAIRNAEPEVPAALNDRQQDAWTTLCAIADLAGGGWPDRARAAAAALCHADDQEAVEGDIKTMLLADIRDIFTKKFPANHPSHEATRVGRPDDGPRLATKRLLEELCGLEERPWAAFGKSKKPLADVGLAGLLRTYQIRSRTVRFEDATGNPDMAKGYFLRSFEDAFTRYLPSPPLSTLSPVTNARNAGKTEVFDDVTNSVWHGSENLGNISNSGVCHGCEGKEGGIGRVGGVETESEPDETFLPVSADADSHQNSAPRDKLNNALPVTIVASSFRLNSNTGKAAVNHCFNPDEVSGLVGEVLTGADGPVALDLETAPLPDAVTRLRQLNQARMEIVGQRKGSEALEKEALEAEIKRLDAAIAYAETAGRDPRRARIRLLQLCNGELTVVIDLDRIDRAILKRLNGADLAAHNAAFDLAFLEQAGVRPGRIDCTLQAARLMFGVESLKDAARESLGVTLDKTEQTGDWNAPELTPQQLTYAAKDARICWRLSRTLLPALGPQRSAYDIQMRAVPAVMRMERRGFKLDTRAHAALMQDLQCELGAARETYAQACVDRGLPELAAHIPPTPRQTGDLLKTVLSPEELRSWPKTSKSGALSTTRSHLRKAAHYPPIAALDALAKINTLLGAFGPTLAESVSPITGRVHAHYHVGADNTGRASCTKPPMQQIPRDKRCRALFIPEPGYVLIVADYDCMEMRANAHISGDAVMTRAFEQGLDLHKLTASHMLGKTPENVTKAERSAAKALNFGSIFGIGAASLVKRAWDSYGVVISGDDAARWLKTSVETYPQSARWRREHAQACETRGAIIIGCDAAHGRGRVYPRSRVPEGKSFYTRCCNYPIQGSCADASMLALATVDDRLFDAGIDGGPVAWLHDEIVLEVRAAQAERAAEILKQSMIDGFAETFPGAPLNGLIDLHTGRSWGEAKS